MNGEQLQWYCSQRPSRLPYAPLTDYRSPLTSLSGIAFNPGRVFSAACLSAFLAGCWSASTRPASTRPSDGAQMVRSHAGATNIRRTIPLFPSRTYDERLKSFDVGSFLRES